MFAWILSAHFRPKNSLGCNKKPACQVTDRVSKKNGKQVLLNDISLSKRFRNKTLIRL